MKRNLFILIISVFLSIIPIPASADISGLIPCKDSIVFKRRLDQSVKKISGRLIYYDKDTSTYLTLKEQIKQTESRFDKYGKQGLLCGEDGLPHLITDGRWDHSGEFIVPSIIFLYIAGWIGWVGRTYLDFARRTDKPAQNEIIINVPIAITIMSSGFLWPLLAWNELVADKLLVADDEVTISPR